MLQIFLLLRVLRVTPIRVVGPTSLLYQVEEKIVRMSGKSFYDILATTLHAYQ